MKHSILFLVFPLMFFITSCDERPDHLGLKDGRLVSCPDKPNCVSSYEDKNNEHYIKPIKFMGDLEQSKKRILWALKKVPGVKVIKDEQNYVYAEVTSAVFKFVDDIEFVLNPEDKVIHVKSASRTGRSDWGVNRKRVEQVRFEFVQGV